MDNFFAYRSAVNKKSKASVKKKPSSAATAGNYSMQTSATGALGNGGAATPATGATPAAPSDAACNGGAATTATGATPAAPSDGTRNGGAATPATTAVPGDKTAADTPIVSDDGIAATPAMAAETVEKQAVGDATGKNGNKPAADISIVSDDGIAATPATAAETVEKQAVDTATGENGDKPATDNTTNTGKRKNYEDIEYDVRRQKLRMEEIATDLQEHGMRVKFREDDMKICQDEHEMNSKFRQDEHEMNSKFRQDEHEMNSKFRQDDMKFHQDEMKMCQDETKMCQDEHEMRMKIRQDELNNMKEFDTVMSLPLKDWQNDESLSSRYNIKRVNIYLGKQTNNATTSSGMSASTINTTGTYNESEHIADQVNYNTAPIAEPTDGPAPTAKVNEGGVPVGGSATTTDLVNGSGGPGGSATTTDLVNGSGGPSGSATTTDSVNWNDTQTKSFLSKKTYPELKIPTNVYFKDNCWRWRIQKHGEKFNCKVRFKMMQQAIDSLDKYNKDGIIDET